MKLLFCQQRTALNACLTGGLFILWCCSSSSLAAENNSDWHPLFNGRDLDNWTQNGSARWIVKDGIIEGGQEGDPKRAGLLSTKEKFKDFELELEFMIDEHGKYNSGVICGTIRTPRGGPVTR